MDWFLDEIHLKIVGGQFSCVEAERIGEFIAVAIVRGIEEAIIADAERASLIYDLLPQQWLEAAGFVPKKFDGWYFEMTGKRRVRREF
jgi:hypothetical protein